MTTRRTWMIALVILAVALASGAGAEVHIPPGNTELSELLQPYA